MAGIGFALSIVLLIGAGVSVALQQVLNANLRAELGSPWWAGFVSYAVGMVVMLVAALVVPGNRPGFASVGSGSWLSWTGGLFGAIFVAAAIFMVPRLGAATVVALLVVGQMTGSIVFDHFGLFGLAHHPVNLTRLLGAALLIGGVVLIRL